MYLLEVCRTDRGLTSVGARNVVQAWPSTALLSGSCSSLRLSTSATSFNLLNK